MTGYLPQNYGAAGGYYDAHKLPAYTFHFGGAVFKSWDMRPVVGSVLAGVPAARSIVPVPGDSVSLSVSEEAFPAVSPEVGSPHSGTRNTGNSIDNGKWYEFILAYMTTPAGRGLWQTPARGVRELARVMSRHETGSEESEDSYVSIASKMADRIRTETHLPGGEKLGTDITSSKA